MNESKEIEWSVINLHEGLTPSIEIKSTDDLSNIFPITANFKLDYTIYNFDIQKVYLTTDNKNNVLYKFNKNCIAKDQDFKIVSE